MIRGTHPLAVLFFACALGCAGTRNVSDASRPRVAIRTELGTIVVELRPDCAPITSKNFLRYVDEARFAGASFYRTVTPSNQPNNEIKIGVIQGGIGWVESDLRLPPIEHETTRATGLLHGDGVLSMARAEPGTAASEFFICVGDQPELDFGGRRNPDGQGFAAFGRVVEGMEIVREIHGRPEKDQMLEPPVRILSVTRVR
jgi:peptidyl-prolyl cis-trans isomerase A (cyclophilin A)